MSEYKVKGQAEAISNIKYWIKSWFDDIETDNQYKHSLASFKSYFNTVRKVLGDHYSNKIEEIVENITGRIETCGNHHIMTRTTFRAKASSIAEETTNH